MSPSLPTALWNGLTPGPLLLAAGALLYLAIWLLAMLRCRAYARLGSMMGKQDDAPATPVPATIVVTHRGKAEELKARLPLFLEQNHPQFEVVLMAMAPLEPEAQQWLDTLSHAHPTLTILSLPAATRNISPEALALTLTMRTARYDWVVLTDISVRPASPQWLRLLTAQASPSTSFVCGFTMVGPGGGATGRKARFLNLWRQMVAFPQTASRGLYCAPRTNILVQRPTFLSQGGLSVAPTLREGIVPIAVNRLSRPANTRLCLSLQAAVWTEAPQDKKAWMNGQLFRHEATQHFTRGILCALSHRWTVTVTWLQSITWLAAMALNIWTLTQTPAAPLPIVLCVALTAMWGVHAWWRQRNFQVTTDALDIQPYRLSLTFYLHRLLMWDFNISLHYDISDKNQYKHAFSTNE